MGPRLIGATVAALAAGGLSIVLAWATMLGGASAAAPCGPAMAPAGETTLGLLFDGAAQRYGLGPTGPAVLAAIADIESNFGRDMGPSKAGAVGFMQFLPSTWREYGVDADGDGHADPGSPADAIFTAGRYLQANGAPASWSRAIFVYNHSADYVRAVLAKAHTFAGQLAGSDGVACASSLAGTGGVVRYTGPGALAAIPGFPSQRVDERILPDVVWLIATYHVAVSAAYATTGHAADGEHPLGLAVDLVPGPGGNWDDVDRLAAWAEPEQNHPRPPFRWVGYNGDPGHGRGNHLHLSWAHSPTPPGVQPVAWVEVFVVPGPVA